MTRIKVEQAVEAEKELKKIDEDSMTLHTERSEVTQEFVEGACDLDAYKKGMREISKKQYALGVRQVDVFKRIDED
jgi:hypothetical protein